MEGQQHLSLLTGDNNKTRDVRLNVLYQRVLGMEQAPQDCGHDPKLLEFKKHQDNSLRQWVGILGAPVWRQRFDLMIFMGTFQLKDIL